MWVTMHFGRGCEQCRWWSNDSDKCEMRFGSVSKQVRITHKGGAISMTGFQKTVLRKTLQINKNIHRYMCFSAHGKYLT